jgi:hypothetical protein
MTCVHVLGKKAEKGMTLEHDFRFLANLRMTLEHAIFAFLPKMYDIGVFHVERKRNIPPAIC